MKSAGTGTMRTHPNGGVRVRRWCIGVVDLLESEGDVDMYLVLARTKPRFDLFGQGALCFVSG